MDLKQIKELIKNSDGEMLGEKKKTLISNLQNDHDHAHTHDSVNSASALQLFLDHIPISSIPAIHNSPGVELKSSDNVKDAIQLLYEMEVTGAPISDVSNFNYAVTASGSFTDRYVGLIDLASMVLWSLEEYEKAEVDEKDEVKRVGDFFSMLDQFHEIGETKIGELGKSFLLDPFIPVHIDDTLLHVLLLFANHRLHIVPVMDRSKPLVTGFVTQNAVIQVLLQSSGLDWFDQIADTPISEFHFEHEGRAHVCGDQSVDDVIHILERNKNGIIAVIDQETKRVIGSVSKRDVHLLLDNADLFNDRRKVTVEELIHQDTISDPNPTAEYDLGALISAGSLSLRSRFLPKMDAPITHRKTDTLKQVMDKMTETRSNYSFLVDEFEKYLGVVTMLDMIVQFAPPSIDSKIGGGGFFQFALEQTGCRDENGTVVCDK